MVAVAAAVMVDDWQPYNVVVWLPLMETPVVSYAGLMTAAALMRPFFVAEATDPLLKKIERLDRTVASESCVNANWRRRKRKGKKEKQGGGGGIFETMRKKITMNWSWKGRQRSRCGNNREKEGSVAGVGTTEKRRAA
jgi:hypothetical protein